MSKHFAQPTLNLGQALACCQQKPPAHVDVVMPGAVFDVLLDSEAPVALDDLE